MCKDRFYRIGIACMFWALLTLIGWGVFNIGPMYLAPEDDAVAQDMDNTVHHVGVASGDAATELDAAVPITNPQPLSTLLAPGTTALTLTVESAQATSCAYAVGDAAPYGEMTPFDQGMGSTAHQTIVENLNPDPNVVNGVYVRCASQPEYLLQLKYRSLSQVNPSYPRIGNIWGWWDLRHRGLPYMARVDLWLAAASAPADEIRELRTLNPDMLILTNINAVDGDDLPDDYYLKDISGKRLEVRPNFYRLNLTKPHVAEFQAQYAYQRVLESDMMFDGVFFDNVFITQSWKKTDVYGDRFLIDADEDGVEDDPDLLDAAWKAGVLHELETFRELMPHAIVSGHGLDKREPSIANLFNGISRGFRTADVLEGERQFGEVWHEYNEWFNLARLPQAIMIEASPIDQIAYGYGYVPKNEIPPSTLEFARTYYPFVRFGLVLVLMNDGYFTYEFGDAWHGNDWWYDELDYELGYPLGPAQRIMPVMASNQMLNENLIVNGSFEDAIDNSWRLLVNESEGGRADIARDTADAAVGTAAARIDVTAVSGTSHHIKFAQSNHVMTENLVYDVSFWAKSDARRRITLSIQKESEDRRALGLWQHYTIHSDWRRYTATFVASETADDARLQFLVGDAAGRVWVDDVQLLVRPQDVYQRQFTHGLVLLNGTDAPQEVRVGPGYRRLEGQQAPRYETIIDDTDARFSTTGSWTEVIYDSGELTPSGPYYHCWQEICHERDSADSQAIWDLEIEAADTYTITAWWPAAPQATGWNQAVTYSVVVREEGTGEQVIASTTFDQRFGGDEWHFVAAVPLSPNNQNYVRMECAGDAPCIADALHVRSRARYNDGSDLTTVTLQPLDGIILAKTDTFKKTDTSKLYLPLLQHP